SGRRCWPRASSSPPFTWGLPPGHRGRAGRHLPCTREELGVCPDAARCRDPVCLTRLALAGRRRGSETDCGVAAERGTSLCLGLAYRYRGPAWPAGSYAPPGGGVVDGGPPGGPVQGGAGRWHGSVAAELAHRRPRPPPGAELFGALGWTAAVPVEGAGR